MSSVGLALLCAVDALRRHVSVLGKPTLMASALVTI